RVTPNDTVTNSYTLKMMNMSQQPRTYLLKVEGLPNATMDSPDTYNIRVNELREISVNLEIDPAIAKLPSSKTNIEFIV
ncbi:FixG Ig-like domain-containing protein, partial [Gilvimarinus sp. 1_MG-2023]|uniref:FixG Ig-like domain-containing protein n=1 Tax=Gilvimarinus sp. 1_MG-2023 TaxID=3062638 RepID=UPI0026E22E1C